MRVVVNLFGDDRLTVACLEMERSDDRPDHVPNHQRTDKSFFPFFDFIVSRQKSSPDVNVGKQ